MITLFLRLKRYIPNILLMLGSFIVTGLFIELCFRVYFPQDLNGTWRVQTKTGLLVNKSTGTARGQHGDRIVTYGFSYPHLRDSRLDPDATQILTLGDSFTFGSLVNKQDTYVYHLQQFANDVFGEGRFNFINAASPGWGTSDYVAYVEEFGEIVNPNIILVFVNTDDIGRSLKSKLYTLLDSDTYDMKRHHLRINYLKKVINSVPLYPWLLEHCHLLQFIRARFLLPSHWNHQTQLINDKRFRQGPNSSELNSQNDRSIKFGQSLFMRLKKWCDQHHVALYVVTTHWHGPFEVGLYQEPTMAFMSQARGFFKSLDIPFSDYSSVFYKTRMEAGNTYIVLNDGHPNELGSKAIADYTWLFLEQQLSDYSLSQ